MARIRSIKPEFWTDGKIRRLSDSTALFFIALWNFSDDYGYFPLDTFELSMKTSRWRSQDMKRMLWALHGQSMVRLSWGHGVGMIRSWEHQRIKDRRPSKWNDKEIVWDEKPPETSSTPKIRPGEDRIGEDRIGEERTTRSATKLATVGDKPPPLPKGHTVETREAYEEAYRGRYGTDPLSNDATNGVLSRFVKRVGMEVAPAIASFYVTHNDAFYVKQMHPVTLLLKDAEKLHTEWVTGRKMTGTIARQAEQRTESQQVFESLKAKYESEEL